MDLELTGKVAVVTGASVGLGREIARVLAAEGVRTIVTARRANLLATLQDEIESAGGPRPLALPVDLYAPDAAARIRDRALSAHGRVDILINNAGARARSRGIRPTQPGTNRSRSTSRPCAGRPRRSCLA
jgi:3-oxoacyl-[acyl-carrier protein] reductase